MGQVDLWYIGYILYKIIQNPRQAPPAYHIYLISVDSTVGSVEAVAIAVVWPVWRSTWL